MKTETFSRGKVNFNAQCPNRRGASQMTQCLKCEGHPGECQFDEDPFGSKDIAATLKPVSRLAYESLVAALSVIEMMAKERRSRINMPDGISLDTFVRMTLIRANEQEAAQ